MSDPRQWDILNAIAAARINKKVWQPAGNLGVGTGESMHPLSQAAILAPTKPDLNRMEQKNKSSEKGTVIDIKNFPTGTGYLGDY